MRTYELPSTIPDVKMLLALAPEELRWTGSTDGSC
jgi:hypothetical protein